MYVTLPGVSQAKGADNSSALNAVMGAGLAEAGARHSARSVRRMEVL